MSAVPWPEARRLAWAAPQPRPPRVTPLAEALGATLAEPLVARVALPGFDAAAMDGWAVRGPGPWRVVGGVLAGGAPVAGLADGEAVAVATGAAVPAGSAGVLVSELGVEAGGVLTGPAPAAGRHVRRRGEEVEPGLELLPAGTPVTAAALGLAAASGHDDLTVRSRPSVAALLTGDELVEHGLPRTGRVRDAVGPQLVGVVAGLGGRLAARAVLADDRARLREGLRTARADVLLTCGASAAGPADHLRPLLAELGARTVVDGVRCRPGHPQLLAELPSGLWVVGLPGNPLAAVTALYTLVGPLLAGLAGRPMPATRWATTVEPLPGRADDTRLVPVRRTDDGVVPTGAAGPAMLLGLSRADALAVVPPGDGGVAAGAPVELLPLVA